MRVFRISDTERHWFAAATEADALECYRSTYDDEVPTEELVVDEIPRERWATIRVHDDDVPGGVTSIEALVGPLATLSGRAFLVCSTVW